MRPYRSLVLAIGLLATFAVRADTVELTPDHPDRYIVQKGDTLWDISGRFLKDPWRWPNIWNKNQQIENPHRIYPGDTIVLRFVAGQPELSVERGQQPDQGVDRLAERPPPGAETPVPPPSEPFTAGPTVKVDPSVREEPLEGPIPTIKPDTIMPFLTQPLAVERNQLRRTGYISGGVEGRVLLGSFSQFYARGLGKKPQERYQIFRPGKPLKHPDTGEVLAYEALYLGEAALITAGDPAKLEVTAVKQEILPTDRLLAAPEKASLPYYYPRAPKKKVSGRILSAINSVVEFGPNTIIAVSLGRRDGLEEGHVLRIMRHVGRQRDPVTKNTYKLPDEESGLMMVFRTFDRISYALILEATRPIHIYDVVKTP